MDNLQFEFKNHNKHVFSFNYQKKKQRGQVIIVLLLFTLVVLAIGITVTQRSVSDLSTSTQSDQSTRAFSAAEAGIEKALAGQNVTMVNGSFGQTDFISEAELGNQSKADVQIYDQLPTPGQAIEYPPIGKGTVAQFWLAHPDNLTPVFTGTGLSIYFGDPDITDVKLLPAMEVNIITRDSSGDYKSNRKFYDPVSDANRGGDNGFTEVPCLSTNKEGPLNTVLSPTNDLNNIKDRYFKCVVHLTRTNSNPDYRFPSGTLILVRIRFLYSDKSHPIALKPVLGYLPEQIKIITSIGKSGQSQKTVQLFQQKNVVPPFLDFAIFSVDKIEK